MRGRGGESDGGCVADMDEECEGVSEGVICAEQTGYMCMPVYLHVEEH